MIRFTDVEWQKVRDAAAESSVYAAEFVRAAAQEKAAGCLALTLGDLEQLPHESKLLAGDGKVWVKNWQGSWRSTSMLTRQSETLLTMKSAQPLRLIWTP